MAANWRALRICYVFWVRWAYVYSSAVKLANFLWNVIGKTGPLSCQCSDVWSTAYTEVTFKSRSFLLVIVVILCDKISLSNIKCDCNHISITKLPEDSAELCWVALEPAVKYVRGNLLPSREILSCVDSYWNDWILPGENLPRISKCASTFNISVKNWQKILHDFAHIGTF